MSSINFTGLKSIKIGSGSTEATVYFRGTKLWPTGEPSVISPTFAVVDDITAYTDTTYVDVYDKKTSSWYKLNDLNVYEKYGIYEKVTSLDRAETSIVKCEVDLNNQWRESTYWSQTGYTCYESNSNYNVNNGYSSMKVIISKGMSSVTVYFGSNGESTYDYSVLWQLDKNKPTSLPAYDTTGVVASSRGKQGTTIEYTYKISDTSKSHFFWITYRKDSSNHSGTDRGYLLIQQGDISVTTGTTVYPGKLVIYNNDEYKWNDNQWMRLGSITNNSSWNLLTTSYDKTIAFTKIAFCKPWRPITYDMYLSDEPNDSYTGTNSKAFKNRIYLGQDDRPHIVQQALGPGETAYENPAASLYGTTTINGNSFYVWDKYTVPRYYAGVKAGAVFDNNMMYVYVNKTVYPLQYPEKDTPPTLIKFNSVEERDAYTQVYNGLLCKVGDDYYVYNNGWKYGPVFAVAESMSKYDNKDFNWVYDRSTKTWNHLENNSYRALTVPTTINGIYIVDENYNFVVPSNFSGNADNAIGIAFLNWSRTFTDSNRTVVTNNFIMGAPQINTDTWLTNTEPVDNRSSYLSLPLFKASGNWNTTDPSTSNHGNATGEDETQIVEDAINAGTLENCTMVPYVRKFFNNKNNILKDFPYQLGYVPSVAEIARIMGNTYGTTTSHTAFEKLGYRNFDNDSSVNKTNFVTIDKTSSDVTYKWPNKAAYMYTPTNGSVGSIDTYVCKNVIPCMNPLLITPPTLIKFNSVEERDAYTQFYNGLLCKVGSDYYEYNNGWKDYSPYVKVDNTIYPTGKWIMSNTKVGNRIDELTVTVESPVECIVYAKCDCSQYSVKASIVVDGTRAAYWDANSSSPGSCTLTPGTHTVTFSSREYTSEWSYLITSKCYIQVK